LPAVQAAKCVGIVLSSLTCKIFTGAFFVAISGSFFIAVAKKEPGMIFETNK
jgi:hypothetical protein